MASDNTTTDLILRTSHAEPDSTHSFFGSFPREIRDEIYDLLFQEKEHPVALFERGLDTYYSKIRTTLPHVRLVSHRLKLEYDERDEYHLPQNTLRVCHVILPEDGPNLWGFMPKVPTLAVRTTVLHFDLKCCRETQDPQKCLISRRRSWTGIWNSPSYLFEFPIAKLPLLKKMHIDVSCNGMKSVVDSPSAGHPSAEPPILAQTLLFHDVYVQDSSQDDSIEHAGQKSQGTFPSRTRGFLVRRRTKAIWTLEQGWDNEARLHEVRYNELYFDPGGRGVVYF